MDDLSLIIDFVISDYDYVYPPPPHRLSIYNLTTDIQ
jgi:hypothetical protein